MKLAEVRSLGIKYCEENNCKYTYISHNDTEAFYLADKEDRHTVFFVNRNGSLHPYRETAYAIDFHKELAKRKKSRRKNYKQKIAEIANCDLVNRDWTNEGEAIV